MDVGHGISALVFKALAWSVPKLSDSDSRATQSRKSALALAVVAGFANIAQHFQFHHTHIKFKTLQWICEDKFYNNVKYQQTTVSMIVSPVWDVLLYKIPMQCRK